MNRRWQRLISLVGIVLVSACGSSGGNPVNYYLLDPVVTTAVEGATTRPLVLEILDLVIPQYLERFQIATRGDGNQLRFADDNQWGENLRKNLMRTMVQNLAPALGTIDIGTPISRTSSLPDYRLQIYIEQFEWQSSGRVRLSARWQLTDGATGGALSIHALDTESAAAVGRGDYAGIVASMQALYGSLCLDIAKSVVVEQGKRQ